MSSNIQIEKVCQWCGKNFIARTTQTAYCSKRCAEHAYYDKYIIMQSRYSRSDIKLLIACYFYANLA